MDRLEQIRRDVEREMLEKDVQRLDVGPIDAPVEHRIRGEPWLCMPRWAAEAHLRAEHAAGVRHQLRTKEAILAFLVKHGISCEVIDHEAERNASVEKEAHKRMKAAALNRRRHVVRHRGDGLAFL